MAPRQHGQPRRAASEQILSSQSLFKYQVPSERGTGDLAPFLWPTNPSSQGTCMLFLRRMLFETSTGPLRRPSFPSAFQHLFLLALKCRILETSPMDPETSVNTGSLLQMLTLRLPFSTFRPDYHLRHAKKWHPAITKHVPKRIECMHTGRVRTWGVQKPYFIKFYKLLTFSKIKTCGMCPQSPVLFHRDRMLPSPTVSHSPGFPSGTY